MNVNYRIKLSKQFVSQMSFLSGLSTAEFTAVSRSVGRSLDDQFTLAEYVHIILNMLQTQMLRFTDDKRPN